MVISTVRKEGKRHTAGPQCRGNSGSQAALFRGSAHLRIHEQGNERKALVVRRRSILDQRPCRTSLRIAGHGRDETVRNTLPAQTPGEFSGQIKQHDGNAANFLSLMAKNGDGMRAGVLSKDSESQRCDSAANCPVLKAREPYDSTAAIAPSLRARTEQ